MTASTKKSHAKVSFQLAPGDDGFPPADWEHLWADAVAENQFRLDNTPFCAEGVSCGDIVRTVREGGRNVFREVVRAGGHSTIRANLKNPASAPEFVIRLSALGCAVEQSHIPGYLAVDVPPGAVIADLFRYLDRGEMEGHWDYEVSAWAA